MTQERSVIHSLEMRCTQCEEPLLVELNQQENAIMVAPCWGCINEKVNDAWAILKSIDPADYAEFGRAGALRDKLNEIEGALK